MLYLIFDIPEGFISDQIIKKSLNVNCNNFLFSLFNCSKNIECTLKHILLKKETSTFFKKNLTNGYNKLQKLSSFTLNLLLKFIENLNNHKNLTIETGRKVFWSNASLTFILDQYKDLKIVVHDVKMFFKPRLFNLENITAKQPKWDMVLIVLVGQ
jgi:hypothetical protein